ncbi:hypothetical protein BDE02_02G128000 [Populus trichocarpa]|nr:hypothetical protein BDE02_02G128000 [Populus trichocarpa]
MGTISCCMVYLCFSALFRPPISSTEFLDSRVSDDLKREDRNGDYCRGIEHLELWGDAVKWGSEYKVNSSKDCCLACKGMCSDDSGPCLCDSWVFCGDKLACGDQFGECWLKKQKDTLEPEKRDSGDHVVWTSGVVFGRGEVHYLVKVLWMLQCSPSFSLSTVAPNIDACAFSQLSKGNS